MKKKDMKQGRVFLGILIIIVSIIISNEIKQEFPSIVIDREEMTWILENSSGTRFHRENGNIMVDEMGKSKLHHYCPEQSDSSLYYVIPHALDENYVKEGDFLVIKSQFYSDLEKEKFKKSHVMFAGLDQDNLKFIEEGENELLSLYYTNKKYNIHVLTCVNATKMLSNDPNIRYKGTSTLSFIFVRPSFLEGEGAYIALLITIVVVLGELVRLIEHFFLS